MKRLGIALVITSMLLIGCSSAEEPAQPAPEQKRESGLVDLTTLNSEEKLAKTEEILGDPDRFENVVVRVDGIAKKYKDSSTGEEFYMVLTSGEGSPEGFCYVLEDDAEYPKSGNMITISGILANFTREVDGESMSFTELRMAKLLDEIPKETPTPTPTPTPAPTAVPIEPSDDGSTPTATPIDATETKTDDQSSDEDKAEDKTEEYKTDKKDSKDE